MELKIVHEPSMVYELLKTRVRYNYIYQFHDLSENEWQNVVCFGLFDHSLLQEVAMLLLNYDIPVLLAANFGNVKYNIELVSRMKKFLPPRFYTHMDKDVLENVFDSNAIINSEEYVNMGLVDYTAINQRKENEVIRLGFSDLPAIKELMEASHPEAWLDDELVKLNKNFGLMVNGKLISFAGIHAYSEQYQVAAVAHITTHPDYRRRGYCEKVTSSLLKDLRDKIQYIGLNVRVNNIPAIRCYKKLGFKEFDRFVACEIRNSE